MESKLYNQKGEESGKIKLPEAVFGLPWNSDLVHQVVLSYRSNARTPVAHSKGRSEVRGGGIKPWRQKGTGRARHGSSRSPLWSGGGVTHGPNKDRDFSKKINKKMKTKALYMVLSQKLRDEEILFIDKLDFSEPEAKAAKDTLSSISNKAPGFGNLLSKKKNSALIALFGKDENTEKSFANFGNLKVEEVRNLNPLDLLQFKYLIISNPKESLDLILGKSQKTNLSKGEKDKTIPASPSKKKELETALG